MTEPTPPPGRDDDFGPVPGADFDAILGLVHASIDDELTAEEQASIQPDEAWRIRVSSARAAVGVVQAALPVPPADEDRREAHLTTALAAFDELHGAGDDLVPTPAGRPQRAPGDESPPRPPRSDELASRRNAKSWLRRAPLGIAAAVLAAVVVVGATQLGDDDAEETATVADSDAATDDAITEAAGEAADGAATAGGDAPATQEADGQESGGYSTASGAAAQFYSMNEEPGSIESFVDTISALVDGDERDLDLSENDSLDLGPTCDRQQAVRLAATPEQEGELTWIRAVIDDRTVVGVINRADPSQVTIIDLDRCEVVAVESL